MIRFTVFLLCAERADADTQGYIGYVCFALDTCAIQANQKEKPTAPPVELPPMGAPREEEEAAPVGPAPGMGADDGGAADDDSRLCFFDGLNNFKCKHKDEPESLRKCIGVSGTDQVSSCKRDGGEPYWFHHFCYVAFYKDIKKRDLQDSEQCTRCPECQPPKLQRPARGNA